MKSRLSYILVLTCITFCLPALGQEKIAFDGNWGEPGFNLVSQSPSGVEIVFSVPYIQLDTLVVGTESLKKILLPSANRKNIEEIPRLLRRDLDFAFVRHIQDVFDAALIKAEPEAQRPKSRPPAEEAALQSTL